MNNSIRFFRSLLSLFLCTGLVLYSKSSTSQNSSQAKIWLENTKAKIKKTTLPNGLNFVTYAIPDSYKVFVGISYNAGSKNEIPGEFGLAHAVEHMIFKGTKKMSESDLNAIAEKYCIGSIGQGYNAYTTADNTSYFFHSDKNNWPVFLEIIADCMYNCRFDKEHFASEVKAIFNEMKAGQANPHKTMYNNSGREFLSPSHPYHHPTIGDKKDLFNATNQELKNFYFRNYHPSKAVVTIIGDFDQQTIQEIVSTTFNKYHNEASFANKKKNNNHIDFSKILTEDFAKKKLTYFKPIPNPIVKYHWQLPLPTPHERAAFKLLNFTLAKRFDKTIQDENDLVYNINCSFHPQHLCSSFSITFNPKNKGNEKTDTPQFSLEKKTVKKIKKLIKKEFKDLTENGPNETEVTTFKKLYQSEILNSFESCDSLGQSILYNFFPEQNEHQLFENLEHAQTIEKNDVSNIITKYLRPKFKNTFKILPLPEDEKDHWKYLQESIDQQDSDILQQKIRTSTVEPPQLVHELPEPQLIDFNFENPDSTFALDNGLTVYLKHKSATPFVSTQLSFKNAEDVSLFFRLHKQWCLQSFAMNMLHDGSNGFSKQDNRDFFHSLGGSFEFDDNGGTFYTLPDDYNKGAQRFVYMLKNPAYPKKILQQSIQRSIHGIIMNQQESFPTAIKKIYQYLFKDYPWLTTDKQNIEELKAIELDQLFAFNKSYVNPSSMYLVVVGNYDPDNIKQQLEDTFGTWEKDEESKQTSIISVPEINNPAPKTMSHFLPKEQVVIVGGRVTTYRDTNDRLALRLLELYCNKKLFEIREQTGLFYSASLSLSRAGYKTKGSSLLASIVTPKNLEKAQAAFKQTLTDISQNGIPEQDLITAKRTYHMTLVKSFATSKAVLSHYDSLIGNNKDWSYYNNLLEKAQNLSHEEINTVAKQYLNPNDWTFITVGRVNATDA